MMRYARPTLSQFLTFASSVSIGCWLTLLWFARPSVEWWTAYLTGGLIVVGLAQISLFYWQLRIIKESLAGAKTAADAAHISADIAAQALTLNRLTSENELRAYLFLANAYLSWKSGWRLTCRVQNYGKTPAHKVEVACVATSAPWQGAHTRAPSMLHWNHETLGSMAPDGDFFDIEVTVFGNAGLSEVQQGQVAIFLVGRITYIDIFSQER